MPVYIKRKPDELESGIFEKPNRIEEKTVMVNGKPIEFPVKIYESMSIESPTLGCKPACNWMDRARKPKVGSGG